MELKFSIIGGGLTATAMLCQFVERLQQDSIQKRINPSKIGIRVYEKQNRFGPGFPHNDRFVLPFHITNMCASDMGVLIGKPQDFQDRVTQNLVHLQKKYA